MRLEKHLLNEISHNNLIDILQRDCSEYIKSMIKAGLPLLRGVRKNIVDFEKFIPRTDRTATDTPWHIHMILDELFYEKFGWKARSSGVFATSTYHTADFYGNAFYFFPFNGFKYVWHPIVKDLFVYMKKFYIDTDNNVDKELLKEFINTYTDKNLSAAIETGKEIMFKCDAYYLLNIKKYDYIMNDILF